MVSIREVGGKSEMSQGIEKLITTSQFVTPAVAGKRRRAGIISGTEVGGRLSHLGDAFA